MPGALREAVDLAVEDLAERTRDDALRLERVRDLAKLPVELDEPCGQVVEATVCLLAVVLEDERVHLLLQELDVGGQREDVLDRPVVEVEAEAHQPALGRRDERALAARRVLEQTLALDDGAERRGGLAEVRVGDASARPIRRVRRLRRTPRRSAAPAPARSCEPPSSDSRERPRSVAFASARTRRLGRASPPSVTMQSSPADVRVQSDHVAQHVEAEQEAELQLDRHERRKLEQPRASDHLTEEDVASGRQRQRACFGDGRARAADVGLVELERGAQLDDRGGRVPDRRETVADLVVGVAGVDAPRVGENGLEHRPDLVRAAFEEVRVQTLEPRLGAAVGGTRPRAASGGGVSALPTRCGVPASVMRELPPHLRGFPRECNSPAGPAIPSLDLSVRAGGAAPASRSARSRSTSSRSSSVSFQRSKTRTPDGLLPPVSAAMTTGTSGRLARVALAVRNASATASAPSRTAMSTLGSSTASGSRSGVVSSSTSKSRPPSRKRARRRKRGSLLATRTRARGSSSSPSYVTVPRSTRASAALREAHATRSPTSSPRRRTLAGRQLDDLARTAARHRAPRPDLVLDLDDDLIRVEEDGVDREAHERGVDAPAGAEDHALALPEVLAAEQAAHAAVRTVGHDDALADDPAVFPAERQCRHGPLASRARRRC